MLAVGTCVMGWRVVSADYWSGLELGLGLGRAAFAMGLCVCAMQLVAAGSRGGPLAGGVLWYVGCRPVRLRCRKGGGGEMGRAGQSRTSSCTWRTPLRPPVAIRSVQGAAGVISCVGAFGSQSHMLKVCGGVLNDEAQIAALDWRRQEGGWGERAHAAVDGHFASGAMQTQIARG